MPPIDQEVLVSRFRLAVVALATMAASLVLAAGAQARDRNHDRIPDRWERHHHLSLQRDQARRDQDHDGLRNRGEFRARLDPRDADSDNDGIDDGDEHAGTVDSFQNGVLTIALAGGGTLTGQVTDATEIECDGDSAEASREPESGDDRGDDQADDDPGDDDQGDDNDDQGEDGSCGTDALQRGTTVDEAELRARDGAATFEKIELG
jgi:hypothetical protein